MNKELSNILLSGVLVMGAFGSAVVLAQNTTQQNATPTNTAQPQTQAPAFTGSIQVPRGAALYLDMARVSLQDAVAAAQQATGVTTSPTAVELEVENGFLVWSVTIGDQEVIIDAGNGQVLQTLQAEAHDDEYEGEEMGDENDQGEHESGENGGSDD